MASLPWLEVAEIAGFTLRVSVAATVLGAVIGVPLGAALAARRDAATGFLRTLVVTLYGLPPVVAGLLLLMLLSRDGPLGALRLLFTPTAIVLAETLLTAPLVAGLTIAALTALPKEVRDAVASAAPHPVVRQWVLVKEARFGVLAGVMVAFGRALAEVAAALIVGGNIRHETRTLGTAIVQEVAQGDFGFALVLGGILLALALVSFGALQRLEARQRRDGP